MSDPRFTLQLVPRSPEGQGALETYFSAEAQKSRKRLPGAQADDAIRSFRDAVTHLTNRCDDFLTGNAKQVCHLVLGKVQSGKTAHLLGSLAWAADSQIRAAVVFTGITDSLNEQTCKRLESDLAELSGNPIRVLEVPTVRNRRDFADFMETLLGLAHSRSGIAHSGQPLPVLVALKNRARATAVATAFAQLAEVFGESSTVLAIDDESDQASQNAKSRQRKVAPTYRALAAVRSLPMRNIWLSYTATPQAVLLTDRQGELRPDFVAVVPPGIGYFGISEVMAENFSPGRVEVTDFRVRASRQPSCPQSLSDAIWRFFLTAWVRCQFPSNFYCDASIPYEASQRLDSTQMLIHESGMHTDHNRMLRLVEDEWEGLKRLAVKYVNGSLAEADRLSYIQTFSDIAEQLDKAGAPIVPLMTEFATAEGQSRFLNLLSDCKIAVINSDATAQAAHGHRPVDDKDYAQHKTWILIGGDILGRGITIPHLTVNYFLRSSKSPNFDTVLQQLRFCGYRRDYAKWTSIHAPLQSFEDLKHMEIVDRAVWERAAAWDRDEVRIIGETMPRVFYVSPAGARFEPTRSSVRDPDISDHSIGTDSIFGLREIFDPRDFRENLALLKRWKAEAGLAENQSDSKWLRFDDVPPRSLVRLMTSWSGSADECRRLEAVSELFDPGLQELGLVDVPSVTFVSQFLADVWDSPTDLINRLGEIQVTRGARPGLSGSSLGEWREAFQNQEFLPPNHRPVLKTPHIGGGQRSLRDGIPHSAVIFIIEPILALEESRNVSSAMAGGIGFAALSPTNFEIRTIGHA